LGQSARAERDGRDYDAEHYVRTLVSSYASRLRKAFAPQDWEQLVRLDAQLGLWDLPLQAIEPLWIRCPADSEQTYR
jgi:DNA polymerase I